MSEKMEPIAFAACGNVALYDGEQVKRLTDALAEARKVIEPFANYMAEGMDLDNKGNPLPDDQGAGWVYLNHGHFRALSAWFQANKGEA